MPSWPSCGWVVLHGLVGIGLYEAIRNRNRLQRKLKCLLGKKKPHVAVILSGCGVYDGSEIQEATSCLIHLERCGAQISCFAPDIDQRHVVNHITGEEMSETRSVLVESARLVRGQIQSLNLLDIAQVDAVLFPGGFGVAKNLSSFATDGSNMMIQAQVHQLLEAFVQQGKPIGVCCIAPTLIAKLFPKCAVTVGKSSGMEWPYAGTFKTLQDMGSAVVEREANEVLVDHHYKVVSAPAYMHNSSPYRVFLNIGQLVDALMQLVSC